MKFNPKRAGPAGADPSIRLLPLSNGAHKLSFLPTPVPPVQPRLGLAAWGWQAYFGVAMGVIMAGAVIANLVAPWGYPR